MRGFDCYRAILPGLPTKVPATDLLNQRVRSSASQNRVPMQRSDIQNNLPPSESMQHGDLPLCCTVAGGYPSFSEGRLRLAST